MTVKNKNREYRTFDEVQEEYYKNHPEEIDSFLATAFEEYSKDGCTPALLAELRMIARVKGVSDIARQSGISRKGIQKALSEQGNPEFQSINSIMKAMGYQLIPEKITNLDAAAGRAGDKNRS